MTIAFPYPTQAPDGGPLSATRVRAAYTAKDREFVAADASVGALTITLRNGMSVGAFVVVGDDGSAAATNNITVQGGGGETIDGSASYAINRNDAVEGFLKDSATEWKRVLLPRVVYDPVRKLYLPAYPLATLASGVASVSAGVSVNNNGTGTLQSINGTGASEVRFTNPAGATLGGLTSGALNREIVLVAAGGANLTINHEDVGSNPSERFLLNGAATRNVWAETCARVRWDPTTQRWREFSALAA